MISIDKKYHALEGVKRAHKLLKELKNLPEPKAEKRKELFDKYRLLWNYHSNHIEGNTLTYGETQLLLLKDRVSGNHEHRFIKEMKAHDLAVEMIYERVGDKDRELTETDIRQLNKIILVEPFWKRAGTIDGQPTRKVIQPGEYKSTPNSVLQKDGNIHEYVAPEETPALMKELFDWYRTNMNEDSIVLAALVHHRFTEIHPFDDGNGRLARLWMNYIIQRAGFPPVIIPTEKKEQYLNALTKADHGEYEDFISFIAEEVIWSVQLAMKAAKGESLKEPNDLDKRLAVIKREIDAEDDENEIKRLTQVSLEDTLELFGFQLLDSLTDTLIKLNSFYDKPEHRLGINIDGQSTSLPVGGKFPRNELRKFMDEYFEKDHRDYLNEVKLSLQTNYGMYIKGGINSFGCSYRVELNFTSHYYQLAISEFDPEAQGQNLKEYTKRLLHKPLLEEEIEQIAMDFGETLVNHLEYHRSNLKTTTDD
ncbi:Fic family protein [Ekhidna sp.]|uniref:Fic family protein n=1 Tax=Ekhidna sp. TaxID=2608089 RepID=UPI0032EDFE53